MLKQTIELVKEFEGLYLNAYKCPAGVWTIGYGHTNGVKEGQKIDTNKANTYLKSDLQECETQVKKYGNNALLSKTLDNPYFLGALTSFCFNCGVGNLQKLIKNRNSVKIMENLAKYNKGNGKVLKGLTRRRTAEINLASTFYKNCSIHSYDNFMTEYIQSVLEITVDGIYGKNTEKAVREYQTKKNLKVDGIVGKNTWASLL